MAIKYLGGNRRGLATNTGTNINNMFATMAQAILNSTASDTIHIYPYQYNEIGMNFAGSSRYLIGMGQRPDETIFDGYLTISFMNGALANISNYISNITIQNYLSVISANNKHGMINCVVRNNLAFGTVIYPMGNAGANFQNNLFYDNGKNSTQGFDFENGVSLTTYKFNNTLYNEQFKLNQSISVPPSVLSRWLIADCDMEVDAAGTVLHTSIFYGNCRLKKTSGSYIVLTGTSSLQIPAVGTFTNCIVLADKTGTITDNGGIVRVTSIAHGKVTNEYITIRISTIAGYKTPNIKLNRISADIFDLTGLTYTADAIISWNVPLFTNEFKKIFHVLPNSPATPDYSNAIIATGVVGARPIGVEFSLSNFDGGLTNLTRSSDDKIYLSDVAYPGTAVAQSSLVLPNDRLYKLKSFYFLTYPDYINGRYIDNVSDKSSTVYTSGQTVPIGYYLSEGTTTLNSINYIDNDKFYNGTGNTVTGTGQLRMIPTNEWLSRFTFNCKLKKGGVWSNSLRFIIGANPNKVNYVDNNSANLPLYGDGDDLYNVNAAYDIFVTEVLPYEIIFQNNAIV